MKKSFDIAKKHWKPETYQDAKLNDLGRGLEVAERVLTHFLRTTALPGRLKSRFRLHHLTGEDLAGVEVMTRTTRATIPRLVLPELQWGAPGKSRTALIRRLQKAGEPTNSSKPLAAAGHRRMRDWNGRRTIVEVTDKGSLWNGKTFRSLSAITAIGSAKFDTGRAAQGNLAIAASAQRDEYLAMVEEFRGKIAFRACNNRAL